MRLEYCASFCDREPVKARVSEMHMVIPISKICNGVSWQGNEFGTSISMLNGEHTRSTSIVHHECGFVVKGDGIHHRNYDCGRELPACLRRGGRALLK